VADVGSSSSVAGYGVPFLVSAGIVYEIIAFACSSPQTAEINIKTRGGTLMKWVHIGEALGAGFVLLAAIIDPRNRIAIVMGGAVAVAASESLYRHAKVSGMAQPGPSTETAYSEAGDYNV
jgi:hypothetical protein